MHPALILHFFFVLFFLNKQNHQQLSMRIPGAASRERIKTNEIKPVIKATKLQAKRLKNEMSRTEQLGYHCKVSMAFK